MLETIMYVVGFFLITLLIQYLFSKRKHKSKLVVWEGVGAIIAICMLGIIFENTNYFAAIVGFVIADEMGKARGWHS